MSTVIRSGRMSVVDVVTECEQLGFELITTAEGQVWVRDPSGRRLPDWIKLEVARQQDVVCGYLRQIRSPFFPDEPTEADYELALTCSKANADRLREFEPRDVRNGDRWLPWHK